MYGRPSSGQLTAQIGRPRRRRGCAPLLVRTQRPVGSPASQSTAARAICGRLGLAGHSRPNRKASPRPPRPRCGHTWPAQRSRACERNQRVVGRAAATGGGPRRRRRRQVGAVRGPERRAAQRRRSVRIWWLRRRHHRGSRRAPSYRAPNWSTRPTEQLDSRPVSPFVLCVDRHVDAAGGPPSRNGAPWGAAPASGSSSRRYSSSSA